MISLFEHQIGEKVELVRNYERFGDAASGPLLPGDRGTIIEFQGIEGSRYVSRSDYVLKTCSCSIF